MPKLRIGILFGGKSAEHEISLCSAQNVVEALDTSRYEPVMIKIEKNGSWNSSLLKNIDVAFPILHGPFGEDGTMQGLLKIFNIPFIGCGVLGSAVGMDKDVMKRLLREADIPIGKYLAVTSKTRPTYHDAIQQLGSPIFIKPANLGSSVGVNKATDEPTFERALDEAFLFDRKILIEEYIQGRELECGVLGNDQPIASIVGEVIPQHAFYSYEAKYIDEHGAKLQIPAMISSELTERIRALAIKTFTTLQAEGLARVDLFYRNDDEILVNEINTMPGFTTISMYPKLWEASGVTYSELIDRLIQLALQRFDQEQRLKTTYDAA